MSGPKARCPSCGTEWDGPAVFCGECGAPIPGDRPAQLPPRANTITGGGKSGARVGKTTLAGSTLPGSTFASAPYAVQSPVADKGGPRDAKDRPSDEVRRPTTMGIQAAAPLAAERDAKPGRRDTNPGRRSRRVVAANEDPAPRDARPDPEIEVRVEPQDASPAPLAAAPAAAAASAAPPAGAPRAEPIARIEPVRVEPTLPARTEPPAVESALRVDAIPRGAPIPRVEPTAPIAPKINEPLRSSSPSTHPSPDAEETQRLLEDLDAGFESIVRPSAPPVWLGSEGDGQPSPSSQRRARHEADMAEVRELFAGIAVAYARPLRDFMIEVAWGEPTKEWLDVAIPATSALRRAAAAVELPEVDAALEGFNAALELCTGEATIHREARDMLSGAYARLIEALPAVFALEGERSKREPIIVRSLLLQVPGVHKVAIDKLYRAGVHSLDVFYAARPRELAEATGLDEEVTAAICERFTRYRREVAELGPGGSREKERAELATLVATLAAQHDEHERAAVSWSSDAASQRARARKERGDTMLRIDVLLAHMGEVDLQRGLAKLPFQQKIRELQRFLDDAKLRAARA